MKYHSLILALAASVALAASAAPVIGEWNAVLQNTNGSAAVGVTYNVYQGTQVATGVTTFKMVQTGLTGTSAVISAGLTPGTTQCFYATAVDNFGESAPSNQGCVVIPGTPPSTNVKPNAPVAFTVTLKTTP